MITCISPSADSFNESLSTLHFANRAKNIRNEAHINEDISSISAQALIRRYEIELQKLREAVSANQVDRSLMAEMEYRTSAAEREKQVAIESLQRMGRDLEEEKREMDDRVGGTAPDGGDDEWDKETGKGSDQVGRYQTLLAKQRDIMIQLTNRLNDRDTTILHLQSELDRADREPVIAMKQGDDQDTDRLRKRNHELERKIEEMGHIDHLMKERNALKVILESKVTYLLDQIEIGIGQESVVISDRTRRQVLLLNRLVHAAVRAMNHTQHPSTNDPQITH